MPSRELILYTDDSPPLPGGLATSRLHIFRLPPEY